jgi:molybdenum-dependent DNA-binding transcriptional regulator ModE
MKVLRLVLLFVFLRGSDPIASGLVSSLSRPSGRGAELTSLGRRVVQQYRTIEAKTRSVAAAELAELASATSKNKPKR